MKLKILYGLVCVSSYALGAEYVSGTFYLSKDRGGHADTYNTGRDRFPRILYSGRNIQFSGDRPDCNTFGGNRFHRVNNICLYIRFGRRRPSRYAFGKNGFPVIINKRRYRSPSSSFGRKRFPAVNYNGRYFGFSWDLPGSYAVTGEKFMKGLNAENFFRYTHGSDKTGFGDFGKKAYLDDRSAYLVGRRVSMDYSRRGRASLWNTGAYSSSGRPYTGSTAVYLDSGGSLNSSNGYANYFDDN